jgi:hypothetical protein
MSVTPVVIHYMDNGSFDLDISGISHILPPRLIICGQSCANRVIVRKIYQHPSIEVHKSLSFHVSNIGQHHLTSPLNTTFH